MILLVTNQRDITMDYIVLELQRRGIKYFRLNTELLPKYKCTMSYQSRQDWSIRTPNGEICGNDITSAYFRRPGMPVIESIIGDEAVSYAVAEWQSLLKSLYMRLDGLWLNSPTNIILAEDKPLQLLLAHELDFDIPAACVTNDLISAKEISSKHNLIGKPLRQALITGVQESVIFTNRLNKFTDSDDSALALAPIIIQEEIIKKYDVRVTVVGKEIFPVAIFSQINKETEVDWRNGARTDLKHSKITLPVNLERKCFQLVEKLNLKYGAIDFICDIDDKFWFLEINPNGQWAWIENLTGSTITDSIIHELTKSNTFE
jgi:hypothetical protein